MFPIATTAGGMSQGTPDVCKVPAPPAPPVPTPFPNMAQNATAQGTSVTVKVMNMPCLTKNSQIPMSSGDEAGVAGGVTSGMNMGPMTVKTTSNTVKVEGSGAFTHLKNTAHNGSNANMPMGTHVGGSSHGKVFVGG